MKIPSLPLGAALLLSLLHAADAAAYYYVIPYKDRTQNPFWQGVVDGTAYLEDFEDHELNTPYVAGYRGDIGGKTYYNIDGDDGKVDGKTLGYAWSKNGLGLSTYFDFSPNADGELPKYVGAAAFFGSTTIISSTIYYDRILAYDAEGVEITGGNWKTETPRLPDGVLSTEAYRFSGMYYEGGISRIEFPSSFNIDHLTYGYAIPESTAGMLLLGVVGAGLGRRRR